MFSQQALNYSVKQYILKDISNFNQNISNQLEAYPNQYQTAQLIYLCRKSVQFQHFSQIQIIIIKAGGLLGSINNIYIHTLVASGILYTLWYTYYDERNGINQASAYCG